MTHARRWLQRGALWARREFKTSPFEPARLRKGARSARSFPASGGRATGGSGAIGAPQRPRAGARATAASGMQICTLAPLFRPKIAHRRDLTQSKLAASFCMHTIAWLHSRDAARLPASELANSGGESERASISQARRICQAASVTSARRLSGGRAEARGRRAAGRAAAAAGDSHTCRSEAGAKRISHGALLRRARVAIVLIIPPSIIARQPGGRRAVARAPGARSSGAPLAIINQDARAAEWSGRARARRD